MEPRAVVGLSLLLTLDLNILLSCHLIQRLLRLYKLEEWCEVKKKIT